MVMGDILGGIFGGAKNVSQTLTPDPISQKLNELRLQQLQQLFAGSPYANFAQSNLNNAYTPSPAVGDLYKTATAVPNLDNLMSFDDYKRLGLDVSSNYISQIAKPEIMSTMVQQGLEGGGAVSEALAKASAQYSLPFIQSLPQASMGLTMTPFQARQSQAQRAQTLMPIADYDRMLKEQDLLRQQSVVTTGLTGLPYTPTTSTQGKQQTPPLFGFFGQG